MPTLKHDIKSALPPKRTFGTAGDDVRIISRHGHVLIVEGPDKFRFPIIDDDLTERLPDAIDPPEVAIRSAAPPMPPVPSPPASSEICARKKTRAQASESPKPSDNQGSLF